MRNIKYGNVVASILLLFVAVVNLKSVAAQTEDSPSREQLQINGQHGNQGACEELQGTEDAFTIHSSPGGPPTSVQPFPSS